MSILGNTERNIGPESGYTKSFIGEEMEQNHAIDQRIG